MNHIDLYEKTINDLSIDFDIRHHLKQFYCMDLKKACEAIEVISRMLRLKQMDNDTLHRAIKFDIGHN